MIAVTGQLLWVLTTFWIIPLGTGLLLTFGQQDSFKDPGPTGAVNTHMNTHMNTHI